MSRSVASPVAPCGLWRGNYSSSPEDNSRSAHTPPFPPKALHAEGTASPCPFLSQDWPRLLLRHPTAGPPGKKSFAGGSRWPDAHTPDARSPAPAPLPSTDATESYSPALASTPYPPTPADALPPPAHRPPRSTANEIDWPRSDDNSCGRQTASTAAPSCPSPSPHAPTTPRPTP